MLTDVFEEPDKFWPDHFLEEGAQDPRDLIFGFGRRHILNITAFFRSQLPEVAPEYILLTISFGS